MINLKTIYIYDWQQILPLNSMGDSTTAELVVEEVDEKERSGDENGKKADAEEKLTKKPDWWRKRA